MRRAGTILRGAVTMLPRAMKMARQHWKPLAGAASAIVLIVAAIVGATHLGEVKGAVASATLALRQTAAAVSSAAEAAIAVQPAPAEPAQTSAKAVDPPRVRPRRNPPTVRSLTAHDLVESKDVTVQAASVGLVQPVVQIVVPSTDAVLHAAERTELSDALIYSEQDTNVRAPQLLSAGFPGPSIVRAPTLTNRVELIVAADGSVERVKLLTSPRRMSDIMLLSSAKAWRFSPAVQDDRPVRYRLALSWDIDP
jgi:outer membrane biosynthesis protein TonB